jgi:hypothetical protein
LSGFSGQRIAHPRSRHVFKEPVPPRPPPPPTRPGRPTSSGGADRARTDDLRLARAALSQLSYSPSVSFVDTRRRYPSSPSSPSVAAVFRRRFRFPANVAVSVVAASRLWRARLMVGLGRFELPTSRLSGVRSNQLSYRPRGNAPIPWKLNRGEEVSVDLGCSPSPATLLRGWLATEASSLERR